GQTRPRTSQGSRPPQGHTTQSTPQTRRRLRHPRLESSPGRARPHLPRTHQRLPVNTHVTHTTYTEDLTSSYTVTASISSNTATIWLHHSMGHYFRMRPQIGEPFYFETEHQGTRHPHYGRFLRLIPGRLVELTWVTGSGGTEGAETTVTVELGGEDADQTSLTLTHEGFTTEQQRDRHRESWPLVLDQMQQRLNTDPVADDVRGAPPRPIRSEQAERRSEGALHGERDRRMTLGE